MERQWTNQQNQAIHAKGGPLLVSAAAGSGKTAVLVERVIQNIISESNPIPADRFLIATFSNAAASEMRGRIEEALNEKIRITPENMGLYHQKTLLNNSSISTVHSFCLRLVRENFHILNISPDFRIGDESELELLKKESINEVIEEFYDSNNQDFLELVDLISTGRDDINLINTVFSFHNFISAHPFPDKWMNQKLNLYKENLNIQDSAWGIVLLIYTQEALQYCINICKQALNIISDDEKMHKAYFVQFSDVLNQLKYMHNTALEKNWDALVSQVESFKFPRLGRLVNYDDEVSKNKVTSIQKNIKDTFTKDLNNKICIATNEQFKEDILYLKPKINILFDLIKAFIERYTIFKQEKNILDFSDLEHLTLKLLVENSDGTELNRTNIATEISKKFDSILVDEYQDTNEVQDLIFRAVSKDESNLFMVGDVKQSIYRFRQAMPEIFIRRKSISQLYNGSEFPAYISLGKNFRSREGICNCINTIFETLMSKTVGDVDYTDDELLIPGANYPEISEPSGHILLIETDENLVAHEQEAKIIAEKITYMVSSGFKVTDGDQLRPCKYSDFAILIRSRSHIEAYEKALIEDAVPVWSDFSKKFFTSKEIMYLVSFLKAVDNPLSDIDLCSAMLSPMFLFSPDELAEIKINYPGSLYMGVIAESQNNNKKCSDFINCINDIRNFAVTQTVDRVIQYVLDITEFDLKVQSMKNGDQRIANINMLIKQAQDYESAGYHGLSGFNRLIGRMMDEGLDITRDFTLPDTENVVKIMTMHRSKGLEFPICFIANCSKKFNMQDLNASALYHSELGFSSKIREFVTLKQFTTIPHEAIRLELKRETISEEMRILYVALTRAKEHLFITITDNNLERKLIETENKLGEEEKISSFVLRSAKNFSDWILMAILKKHSYNHILNNNIFKSDDFIIEIIQNQSGNINNSIEKDTDNLPQAKHILGENEKTLLNNIKKKLTFEYKYSEFSSRPSKLAVSDIVKQESIQNSAEISLRRPKFMYSSGLSPAEKGNAHHVFMQFADYKNAKENPKEEVSRLLNKGYLRSEEAQVIQITKIRKFFNSQLAKRIFASKKVLRELKFIVANENKHDADSTMIQGVADCVFYEDDGLIIVDYKTDYVQDETILINRYSEQLLIYKKALEESLNFPVKELLIYSFSLGKELKIN